MTTGSACDSRRAARSRPADTTRRPQPLGPDSLTWKYFGDWRGMLQGPWAGSMQNMHPQLGAAVEEHSIFSASRGRGCCGRCTRSAAWYSTATGPP